MKGGGVKGLAFAGAMRELECFVDFQCYVGTSAGAIAAALFACGASGAELEDVLRKKSFKDFLDGNVWSLPFTFWFTRGLHPGYTFVDWLREEVHRRIPQYLDVKMKDLPKRAVTYASTALAGEVTFDKIGEHADSAVHTAVRCSMSIPYLFQPQWIDLRRVYDGGLLHNYPIQIFLDQEKKRNPSAPIPSFIGLYLGKITPEPIKPPAVWQDMLKIKIDKNDARLIDQYPDQTILIDTGPIGTIDFDLSETEKEYLVVQGRIAALEQYIAKRNLLTPAKRIELGELKGRSAELLEQIGAARKTRSIPTRSLTVSAAVVATIALLLRFTPSPPPPPACQMKAVIEPTNSRDAAIPSFLDIAVKGKQDRYSIYTGKPVEFEIQPKNVSGYSIELHWSDGTHSQFGALSGCELVNGRKSTDERATLRLTPHS